MDPCKWIQRLQFTHPPSPHTTPSTFPHQPEWQAYEQMRENQLHNLRFTTLFYKALVEMEFLCPGDDVISIVNTITFT